VAPKTTLATAAVLGLLTAGSASAATTGGAGLTAPAPAAQPAAPVLAPVPGIPQLQAGVALRRVSRTSASAVMLRYASQASTAVRVRVDVVRLSDGLSVFSAERTLAPGASASVRWSGRTAVGVALDGRYELRLALVDGGAQSASAPATGGASSDPAAPPPGSASVGAFTFVGAVFPVQGPHDFGEGAARFGAGRAGHIHEGQDVMATCGTPLVAARGGVVIQRARQWAAGNYLVIHDPITMQDYVYAHLRRPAIVRRGQRVDTGQPIGVVGETGDATTCHLHFEIWTSPGWYAGGSPIDPLPTLQAWDHAV